MTHDERQKMSTAILFKSVWDLSFAVRFLWMNEWLCVFFSFLSFTFISEHQTAVSQAKKTYQIYIWVLLMTVKLINLTNISELFVFGFVVCGFVFFNSFSVHLAININQLKKIRFTRKTDDSLWGLWTFIMIAFNWVVLRFVTFAARALKWSMNVKTVLCC